MITKFKEYKKLHEGVPYDTYNGPSITTWAGDNTGFLSGTVAGGNGGYIGHDATWYQDNHGPTSTPRPYKWKNKVEKPIDNESAKRKKAIEKVRQILQINTSEKENEDEIEVEETDEIPEEL